MSIYPTFIIVRICLTLPMYCTLCIGTNPVYAINEGYQHIDDAVNTQHRRRTRRRSQNDGYEERQTHEDRVQRQIRRQWRLMELERRQMELAMEQSRRESFRKERNEQDREYEKALKEAKEKELEEQKLEEEKQDNHKNINKEAFLSPLTSDYSDMASPINSEMDIMANNNNHNYNITEHINLDPLPMEPEDNNEVVYIRMRLPNGIRSERRFHYTSNIGDIILWTEHECLQHAQAHLIGHSQLISTMPHTVYRDKSKNMKQLNFWRPNSKRKLVSPLLYVEEL